MMHKANQSITITFLLLNIAAVASNFQRNDTPHNIYHISFTNVVDKIPCVSRITPYIRKVYDWCTDKQLPSPILDIRPLDPEQDLQKTLYIDYAPVCKQEVLHHTTHGEWLVLREKTTIKGQIVGHVLWTCPYEELKATLSRFPTVESAGINYGIKTAEIRFIGIAPECQRKRYGTFLMKHTLRALKEKGFTLVALSVEGRRYRSLTEFYQSIGFRKVTNDDFGLCMGADFVIEL